MSNNVRNIYVITIFPELINNFTSFGIVQKGQDKSLIKIKTINLRDYSDNNGYVDDKPYGGGPGMVFQAQPLINATRYVKSKLEKCKCIYLSPQGQKINQEIIKQTAENDDLIIIAGRYEGVDQRFIDLEVDEEWSVGDYVLSGGEIAACVIIDAVARMVPGVLGHSDSNKEESFENGFLEYPHYTRPEIVENLSVPKILLSGDHQKIKEWRMKQAILVTSNKRSDLIKKKLS